MIQVELLPPAVHELHLLDKPVAQRIIHKLRWLAENFESVVPETLAGPFLGLFKLRVGDYRVIYETDREKGLITVHLIGHGKEIYQRR
jgi:mRNA interferase RelE/StbE